MTIKSYTSGKIREKHFIEDDSVFITTSHGKPVKFTVPFDMCNYHEGLE